MGRVEGVLPKCKVWWWDILIFLTVGSQKFQFNRLLEEMDRLVFNKVIFANEVFAQTGYSTYLPKTYCYRDFLDKEEFIKLIDKSEIVITHGGTGSIITSIKKRKKVIGVPRNQSFGEHVDNHQFEIVNEFSKSNFIYAVTDPKELEDAVFKVREINFRKYQSNTLKFIDVIEQFLNVKNNPL